MGLRAPRRTDVHSWIICDGDIDPDWIEVCKNKEQIETINANLLILLFCSFFFRVSILLFYRCAHCRL